MINLGKIKSARTVMLTLQIVFLLWCVYLLIPFFEPIFIGFVMALVFYPLFKNIEKVTKSKNAAAMLALLSILSLLALISSVFVSALVNEFTNILANAETNVAKVIDNASNLVGNRSVLEELTKGKISADYISKEIQKAIIENKQVVLNSFSSILGALGGFVPKLIVIFYLIFYVYVDEDKVGQTLRNLIPLNDINTDELIEEISKNVRGIVVGQGFTSICSGIAGAIGLYIFGFNGALFWGFVMMFLAFLPMIGTNMVWIPAGIISLILGDYQSGLGILFWGFTVMTYVDNIFTPQIISKYMQAHPVAVLLGVFGGVFHYGLIGVFLGPLIFVTMLTLFHFFQEQWLKEEFIDEPSVKKKKTTETKETKKKPTKKKTTKKKSN